MSCESETIELLPVLDVHSNNIVAVWPSIKLGIETACFIALDLELSGLGDRKKLASKCLEERYEAIRNAANSRSIISVGISLFRSVTDKDSKDGEVGKLVTQTYNILALCSQPYVVEPEALKFLTRHGFDFNKQYATGLPYIKGSSETEQVPEKPSLNHLFYLLSAAKKPLVLHNGLVDLIFLYNHLYLDLPRKLSTFLADVEDLFPSAIYDTKYLTEYHIRMKASYLQYIFVSCFEWNKSQDEKVHIEFVKPPPSKDVYHITLASDVQSLAEDPICQQYAAHGWCPKSNDCTESHNVSLIVQSGRINRNVLKNRKRRLKMKERKKKQKIDEGENIDTNKTTSNISYDDVINPFSVDSCTSTAIYHGISEFKDSLTGGTKNMLEKTEPIQNCHRAGVDAFMTGLCYHVYKIQLEKKGIDIGDLGNRLYLSGKNLPMQITKGNFGKVSTTHAERARFLELLTS